MSDLPTPTLAGAIEAVIDDRLACLRTAAPGRVVAYHVARQTADVRLCVAEALPDGTREPDPVLVELPVAFPSGCGFVLSFPLAQGDPVWVVFAERSLDEWKVGTATTHDPTDPRRHHVADAICIPAVRPPANPLPASGASATDLILGRTDGGGAVRIGIDGRVSIGIHGVDLLTIVDTLLAALQSATTATALGPQPLDPATLLQVGQLRAQLAQIRR